MGRRCNTNRRDIVSANIALLSTLPNLEGATDKEELARTCWGCGMIVQKPRVVGRAHVVAASHGGSDDPSNFFLLCSICHEDQPDGAPRESQERWLRSREHCFNRWIRKAMAITSEMTGVPGSTDEELNRWIDRRGIQLLQELRDGKGPKPAGWKNLEGNMRHAIIDSFRVWVAHPPFTLEP